MKSVVVSARSGSTTNAIWAEECATWQMGHWVALPARSSGWKWVWAAAEMETRRRHTTITQLLAGPEYAKLACDDLTPKNLAN
jgi:hypothetical protein